MRMLLLIKFVPENACAWYSQKIGDWFVFLKYAVDKIGEEKKEMEEEKRMREDFLLFWLLMRRKKAATLAYIITEGRLVNNVCVGMNRKKGYNLYIYIYI